MSCLTLSQGLVLAYDRFGRPDGPAVVLVHGMGDHRTRMRALGEFLADEYDVVTVDLPGHGESSTDDVVYELPAFADAIHELVTALDLAPARYVGHSLGATVVTVLAARYPESVDSLVLLDPGTLMETATREQLATFYAALTPENFPERLEAILVPLLSGPDEDPTVLNELFDQQLRTGLPGFLSMGWSLVEVDEDSPAGAITAPTLLVGGETPFVAPARQREVAPDWVVERFAGLGHMQLVDPALVGDRIARFLRDRT
jgi:pimeloyl-ACP methyl ester carboxylesterase